MDLVMIILTVFLAGVVLVLATFCAWFRVSLNSAWFFYPKVSRTCTVKGEHRSSLARQRTTVNDRSRCEQTSGQFAKGIIPEDISGSQDSDSPWPPKKGSSVSKQQSDEMQPSTVADPSLAPLPNEDVSLGDTNVNEIIHPACSGLSSAAGYVARQNGCLRTKLGHYYTKECIQDNPLLVSSTMDYIKLNLVDLKKQGPAQKVGEAMALHLAKGGLEQIQHQKIQVDYDEILIFSPPAGISRKRLLVEGVPGSGKSTLVQRMCYDWSVGCFAQDYEVVIQVNLRNLPKDQKLSLEDLIFTSVSDANVVKEVADYVTASQGQTVLIIFDGFDEMSDEMQEKSIVHEIIAGHVAPQSSFLVTTRPISVENLYHYVDRRVVICGFEEEEIEKYITEYFAFNPSAGEKLLKTLSDHPHIERLCTVPQMLLMVCYRAAHGDSPDLPSTLHQLFLDLILLTVNHNLKRAELKEHVNSLQDVRRLCPSFSKLTELALDGIEKDQTIFPNPDFWVDSALHGLFNCIAARNRFGNIFHIWHFLHLILQEFMAALTVASKTTEEQVSFWKNHLTLKYNKYGNYILADNRYQTMFLLYCGMSGLNIPSMQNVLLGTLNTVVEPCISSCTPLPALCKAVAESCNEQLVNSVLSPCGPTVEIEEDYLKDGGIAWCIAQYCKQVAGAGIRISGSDISSFLSQLGDTSTLVRVELPRMDTSDLPTVRQFLLKQAKLKYFTFGQFKLTKTRIDTVKAVMTHHKESLEEVALHGIFREVALDSLVESFVACQRLTSLELRDISLSLQSLLTIVEELHNLKALKLETVSLSDEESATASAVCHIASVVELHHNLIELTVERCSKSFTGVVEGMAKRRDVEKLAVAQYEEVFNPDRLVPPICAIMRTGSLKALSIGLASLLAEQVVTELPRCTQLVELELVLESDKGDGFSPAFEADLSECTTLQKLLAWGWNGIAIPPSVTAALLRAMSAIKSLSEVSLDCCDFKFEGADETMYSCFQESQVRKLEMTECVNLSPVCLAVMCEGLLKNASLEQLVAKSSFMEEMNGEDVSDPHVLESVKTAVIQNKSVKRIVIEGSRLRWTNVAIAIIEGAQQNTALKELKLETPVIPGLQVVVEKLRKAKPKLQLVVKAGDVNIYDQFIYL